MPQHVREFWKLVQLLKDIGMTRAMLAAELDVSPSVITRVLQRDYDGKSLGADKENNIATAMLDHIDVLASFRSGHHPEALNHLEEKARARAIKANKALTLDRLDRIRGEIETVFSSNAQIDPISDELHPSKPIGSLPVKAANYVERSADEKAREILGNGRAPASIVLAPVNGGTSSFLDRVFAQAQATDGALAYHIDLRYEFEDLPLITPLEIFRKTFRAMGIDDSELTGDEQSLKAAFEKWALCTWRNVHRIVIVIDGLDHLFLNAGNETDPLALTNWLQHIRNEIGRQKAPFMNLLFFVAFTGRAWSAAHWSQFGTQSEELKLEKFDRSEIEILLDQLDLDLTSGQIDELEGQFFGHPYLTHLVAWEIANDGVDFRTAITGLGMNDGHCSAHWERLLNDIEGMIGKNFEQIETLAAVLKRCKVSIDFEISPKKVEDVWDNYGRELLFFGLVDGTVREPTICEFYKNQMIRMIKKFNNEECP